MINFRFHLASLIAVFLALALGIIMGSTVIDRAIVDSLRDRINRVENNADHQKADNNQLRSDNKNLNSYIDQSTQYAVDGQLTGVPVIVVAGRGVDSNSVNGIQSALQESGALLQGTLWLEKKWQLSSKNDLASLQSALHDNSKDKQSLRSNGLRRLSDGLGRGTHDATVGDSLNALAAQGFISLKPPQGSAETMSTLLNVHPRVVVVSGPQDKLTPKLYLSDLSGDLVQAGVSTEVAEIFVNASKNVQRGDLFDFLPKDGGIRQQISTINNAELEAGQVAAVLALADLGHGTVGAYGFGNGAKRTVPEWFAK